MNEVIIIIENKRKLNVLKFNTGVCSSNRLFSMCEDRCPPRHTLPNIRKKCNKTKYHTSASLRDIYNFSVEIIDILAVDSRQQNDSMFEPKILKVRNERY